MQRRKVLKTKSVSGEGCANHSCKEWSCLISSLREGRGKCEELKPKISVEMILKEGLGKYFCTSYIRKERLENCVDASLRLLPLPFEVFGTLLHFHSQHL